LDSANAVEFCKALRLCSDIFGTASATAIYQAPQAAYELFDKVIVLYEGRQIYFGPTNEAKRYFEELGFVCPDGQTTADFLTSMTSPTERIIRPGDIKDTPRTSGDFARVWSNSPQRRALLQAMDDYDHLHPPGGPQSREFARVRRTEQATLQRHSSPYTLSYLSQVRLCLWRAYKILLNDPTITLVQLGANFVQFLVVGSIFYNLPMTAESLFSRGVTIFSSLVLNSIASVLEILTLYSKRPVVEKHNRYALYHPSAEALAAMVMDLPYKVVNAIVINITVYFMANLNRAPGPFFFFLLVSFFVTLTMVRYLQLWTGRFRFQSVAER
jgi:ATP-binding cassette, subfamily G (WHITE), member 2, PDR